MKYSTEKGCVLHWGPGLRRPGYPGAACLSTERSDNLQLTGRIKEIINKGGEKISPLEIDDAIMKHESVFQGITFPIVHNKLGEEIAAAIVLKNDHQLTEQELKEFLRNKLAPFKIPQKIIFLDEIPKGKTGKLQRIGLAKILGLE